MVGKTPRKFKAGFSMDGGETWGKVRCTGWPIDTDPTAIEATKIDGYVIVIDNADTMMDVILTDRDIKMILKDMKGAADDTE